MIIFEGMQYKLYNIAVGHTLKINFNFNKYQIFNIYY